MIKKEEKKVTLEDINNSLKSIDKRFDSLDKKVDHLGIRADNLDRSYHYIGVQMEKLETKFDLALEGYGSLKELGEKMNERLNVLEGRG